MDEQTREYLDRLLAETGDARRRDSKQLDDLGADTLRGEIRDIRAQLAAVEERLSLIEAAARRDHDA